MSENFNLTEITYQPQEELARACSDVLEAILRKSYDDGSPLAIAPVTCSTQEIQAKPKKLIRKSLIPIKCGSSKPLSGSKFPRCTNINRNDCANVSVHVKPLSVGEEANLNQSQQNNSANKITVPSINVTKINTKPSTDSLGGSQSKEDAIFKNFKPNQSLCDASTSGNLLGKPITNKTKENNNSPISDYQIVVSNVEVIYVKPQEVQVKGLRKIQSEACLHSKLIPDVFKAQKVQDDVSVRQSPAIIALTNNNSKRCEESTLNNDVKQPNPQSAIASKKKSEIDVNLAKGFKSDADHPSSINSNDSHNAGDVYVELTRMPKTDLLGDYLIHPGSDEQLHSKVEDVEKVHFVQEVSKQYFREDNIIKEGPNNEIDPKPQEISKNNQDLEETSQVMSEKHLDGDISKQGESNSADTFANFPETKVICEVQNFPTETLSNIIVESNGIGEVEQTVSTKDLQTSNLPKKDVLVLHVQVNVTPDGLDVLPLLEPDLLVKKNPTLNLDLLFPKKGFQISKSFIFHCNETNRKHEIEVDNDNYYDVNDSDIYYDVIEENPAVGENNIEAPFNIPQRYFNAFPYRHGVDLLNQHVQNFPPAIVDEMERNNEPVNLRFSRRGLLAHVPENFRTILSYMNGQGDNQTIENFGQYIFNDGIQRQEDNVLVRVEYSLFAKIMAFFLAINTIFLFKLTLGDYLFRSFF